MPLELPTAVVMTEVGPRDGLQSVGVTVPTDDKVRLIDALSHTGLRRIEATSFVHPRAVPSMADAEDVMRRIDRVAGVRYMALVPNVRGAERAIAAEADELNVVLSVTETFNQRNINMSVADSVRVYGEIAAVARAAGIPAEVGLAGVFGCPYEGDVALPQVLEVVDRLLDVGAEEILFADTIGIAHPLQVSRLVEELHARWPHLVIGLHFHDTRGLGLANVLAGLQAGVMRFDASIGGIGACPFAPGATGNICTEDTVYLLQQMDIDTGIDLIALTSAAALVPEIVGRDVPSRMLRLAQRSMG